jgi:hypothetical protein
MDISCIRFYFRATKKKTLDQMIVYFVLVDRNKRTKEGKFD